MLMLPVISDPESLTTPSSTDSAAQTDTAFDLLTDQRRRAVLRYLNDNEDPVSLSDLADHVALEERDRTSGTIAATGDALLGTRRRIELSLRHVHLPKLAAADAVTFDTDANTVSLCETGTALLAQFDHLRRD
ncbi:DUF7344 domain-containing protein [Natronorubrum bangense]|uniref:DUF7344 domain-containing protein n=2 Tax=Natronorubrum bangense TaxID=61858 RepID=L9WJA8_9EURY|nr:hypothetical protein [Natronorubrum bangense]ELY49560.1 hypothetical protein C494_08177 [Natronorubrum bangense JCM 10635]